MTTHMWTKGDTMWQRKKEGLMKVKEKVDLQSNNSLTNLQLFILNKRWLPQFLERHTMNPMQNNMQQESMDKCWTSCLSWKNAWHEIFLPISRPSVTKILVAIFIRRRLTLITPLELGRKNRYFNDFNMMLFNVKNKKGRPVTQTLFDHAAIGIKWNRVVKKCWR